MTKAVWVPTIRDVAERAGVGVGTVSRYLNAKGPISESAKNRVKLAIAELNFRPNANAAALRKNAGRVIGVLVPDLENPAISAIVKALETKAREYGYAVVVTCGDRNFDIEKQSIATLVAQRVAGLILIPTTENGNALDSALAGTNIPVVLMDRDFHMTYPNVGRVMVAHDIGMRSATEHLIKTGHRSLLLLHAQDNRAAISRIRGFSEALALAPQEVYGQATPCARDPSMARQIVAKAFTTLTPPDAIITGHSRMLSGAITALLALGIVPGRDVSLVTCDRTELAELYSPPIAWVDRHPEIIGQMAFEVFMSLSNGENLNTMKEVATVFHATKSIIS